MHVPVGVDHGLPEPEAIHVTAGRARRDALRRDVVLMGLSVMVGQDRVDRVGLDQVVHEPDRRPVLGEASDRELAEEVVALPASRAQGVPGLRPDRLDLLPAKGSVGPRRKGYRIDVVAGLLFLEEGAETLELDVIRMGADGEDVHRVALSAGTLPREGMKPSLRGGSTSKPPRRFSST